MKRLLSIVAIFAVMLSVGPGRCEIPKLINYQGMLTDGSGTPLSGLHDIVFKIYNAELGGTEKWSETQSSVSVANGLFNVILGSSSPLDLDFSEGYWLEITVDGETMPDRLKFTSVGYAYRAMVADSAARAGAVGGGWTDDGSNVHLTTTSDKVGIGVTNPLGKLHVNTSGWDAAHLYLESPSYGHSRVLQAVDGLLFKNFYATGTNTAFSFRDLNDIHLLDVRADGNVGIGTASPQYKLDVRGDRIQLKENGTDDWMAMRTDGGALDFQFQGGNLYVQSATNGEHILLNPNNASSNVGIGTTTPLERLHVAGTVQMNGFKMPTSASSGKVLTSDANGVGTWQSLPSGGIGGSGTANYIPKFATSTTVGNSVMFEKGGGIGIGTTSPSYKLDVRGDRIQLKEDATGHWMAMRTDGGALDFSFSGAALYMQGSAAGQHILLNPSINANVGIGTTNPAYKLDVRGDRIQLKEDATGHWMAMRTDGSSLDLSFSGGSLYFQGSAAGENILLNPTLNSRVGIGTTSPDGKLEVVGSGCEALMAAPYLGSNIGIWAEGAYAGGGFEDTESHNWCYVGYSSYKAWGIGSNDFVQNHPYNQDQVITYAGLEGDEVGTYTRGRARLTNGEARVALGETFKWVTNPDIGLTAHITPRGKCEGLYVESLGTSEMVVRELRDGNSNAEFDYLVCGLRIGFEDASVVQEKQREAYIPSMKDHRDLYVKYPELRKYNGMERFKQMEVDMGKPIPNMGASRALRDAIHEFDSATDRSSRD
jgi:hypothetical protein